MNKWSLGRGNYTKAYLLLLAFLLTHPIIDAAPFQTSNSKAQLNDRSPAGSPLRATGLASFHDVISASTISLKCSLQGSLTNVSSKTVVAFEAALDISSGRAA
jgi:hypothetical protein